MILGYHSDDLSINLIPQIKIMPRISGSWSRNGRRQKAISEMADNSGKRLLKVSRHQVLAAAKSELEAATPNLNSKIFERLLKS